MHKRSNSYCYDGFGMNKRGLFSYIYTAITHVANDGL